MHFPTTVALAFGFLFVVPVFVGYWTRRLKVIVPVAALVTGTAVVASWISIGQTETLESAVSADGNELVVAYLGGECEDHRSVSIDERTESVRVSITTRSFASACSDVAVQHLVRIELGQPIGSRAIVNVGCTKDRAGCKRVLELTK